MKYVSTRNNQIELGFKDVFIKGLSEEGGLFVPKTLEAYNEQDLNDFKKLNYNDLALKILHPFCRAFIDENKLL